MQETDQSTDIYKSREPMPIGAKTPNKRRNRKRRSASRRAFDETSRKRRSRNTGFRRLMHLWRKGDYQKTLWTAVGIITVVGLVSIAIYQFWYVEKKIREEEQANQYLQSQPGIPAVSEDAR